MLKHSDSKFPRAVVGDNVRVPVPEVDRSKCAARNVIGVVMEVDEEKALYKIGTSEGVLTNLFTRGQFARSHRSFMSHHQRYLSGRPMERQPLPVHRVSRNVCAKQVVGTIGAVVFMQELNVTQNAIIALRVVTNKNVMTL